MISDSTQIIRCNTQCTQDMDFLLLKGTTYCYNNSQSDTTIQDVSGDVTLQIASEQNTLKYCKVTKYCTHMVLYSTYKYCTVRVTQ